MKVLVATHETQGTVPGDYCYTVDGELVTATTVECCEPDRCGCGRGFPGLASSRATTTAIVVERPELTDGDLETAVRDSLVRGGWLRGLDAYEQSDVVSEHLDFLYSIVRWFPEGTVLGRTGDHVWRRDVSALLRQDGQ